MKAKIFLSLLFFTCISLATHSQSAYHFTYNCLKANDATTYKAFLLLNDDGTGLIRIKYVLPPKGDSVLVTMDVQQQYPDMKLGNIDNSKTSFLLSNLNNIKGNPDTKYVLPVLWFKKSTASDEMEPWGVTVNTTDTEKSMNPFSAVDYLDAKKLKQDKNFVLQYFTRQDDFYKNLFESKTKALSPAEKNIKLYMLVVANVNDTIIGKSCAKDMKRSIETFKKLTTYLGIKFDTVKIFGDNYNKQNVEKAIDTLKPGANDIVVFYYTGHGFRKPTENSSRFPFIDLRPKPDRTFMVNSLNIENIFERIKKKNARLTLVISDCCNTEVNATNAVGTPIPGRKGLGIDWSQENVRALFLNEKKIAILAAAADAGQKASSNNEFGSFYSYFFKTSLEAHSSNLIRDVSWAKVLEYAKTQTIYKAENTYCAKPYVDSNICVQTPMVK